MSAETGLARFDTRRAAQDDKHSEQIDLRAVGAREHGQLALDEIDSESRAATSTSQSTVHTRTIEDLTHTDLEAALECARTTVDGLRDQVTQLEAERDRLREELEEGQ